MSIYVILDPVVAFSVLVVVPAVVHVVVPVVVVPVAVVPVVFLW
jgi:hypothetical protein